MILLNESIDQIQSNISLLNYTLSLCNHSNNTYYIINLIDNSVYNPLV